MTAQYTRLLGTVQDSHYDNKCSEYDWIFVHVIKSDRGALKPIPCGVKNAYRGQLLRMCDGSTSESIILPTFRVVYHPSALISKVMSSRLFRRSPQNLQIIYKENLLYSKL